MRTSFRIALLTAFLVPTFAVVAAWAAQTNYLGTIFVADPTIPTHQMSVNADGSINATLVGGGFVTSVTGTANEITASPTTGAVIVSLPTALTFTGKTVTGGTFAAPTVTGSFTATGLVTNADLVNPATTVNGQTCTLGSTCTITASASAITVGSTTIGSGTTGRVLYDNAGTLGEMTNTGTGTVNVLQTSPSLITPALGVATATSVAANCTIGSDTACVGGSLTVGTSNPFTVSAAGAVVVANNTATTTSGTGAIVVTGGVGVGGAIYSNGSAFTNANFNAASNGGKLQLGSTSDTILSRAAAATFQLGAADVDTAPVAQTLRSQGLLAGGTSNQAGANWTFIASPGKGTGTGGAFIFQTTPAGSTGTVVGTPTTALTIDSTQASTFGGSVTIASPYFLKVSSTGQNQIALNQSGSNFGQIGNAAADTWYLGNGSSATALGTQNITWRTSGAINLNAGNAIVQFGAANVDTGPVAQTLTFQGPLVGGTSNVAGPNTTIIGTLGKGNANSGDIIIQTGGAVGASGTTIATATTALTIKGVTGAIVTNSLDAASSAAGALQVAGGASIAKRFWIPAISASAGLQTAVLCQSSGGEMIADSVACLASSRRWKQNIIPLTMQSAQADILGLKPISYFWKPSYNGKFQKDPNYNREEIGLIAEDVARVDRRLVFWEKDGKTPRGVRYDRIAVVLLPIMQKQRDDISALQAENVRLRAANDNDGALLHQMGLRLDRLERAGRTRQARN